MRSTLRCAELADELPAWADGQPSLEPAAGSHVEKCLRCQAAIAQHRRLRRVAGELADRSLPVSHASIAAVLDAVTCLQHPGRGREIRTGRRAAYWGGLAVTAAAAAGAAGALVAAGRARRSRLAG